MPDSPAPLRRSVPDFAGRPITFSAHPGNWRQLTPDQGQDVLLLGLGPGEPTALPFLGRQRRVFWLEENSILSELGQCPWLESWRPATPAEIEDLAPKCAVYFYAPGLKAAPRFWSPIIAQAQVAALQQTRDIQSIRFRSPRVAWLPGSDRELVHRECRQALSDLGFNEVYEGVPSRAEFSALLEVWGGKPPRVVISVNFRGFDSDGAVFYLCRQLGIKLVFWLVDNPWHILARIRLPWWQEASLYVTDPTFMEPLRKSGARSVGFCPLAVAPVMWRKIGSGTAAPAFVGSSAFPARNSFFAGLDLPEMLLKKALRKLDAPCFAELPNYHWWMKETGVRPWPGNAARLAGLGADEMSALNRARWIEESLPCGLEVFGDSGWEGKLPKARLCPPVDYYGSLGDLYGAAGFVLNVTSLLMPGSLNQRHFDVWAAGGFLLTDSTPGLELFPQDLVSAIALQRPEDIAPRAAEFAARPQLRREIQENWRAILRQHTYRNRLLLLLGDWRAGPGDMEPVTDHTL